MFQLNSRVLLLWTGLFVAIGLGGCATGGISTSAPDFQNKFAKGEIRLTCTLSCAGSVGVARKKMRGFYDNKLWMDLAKEVSEIGFDNDQQYFYLGASAAALGYRNAARTYFNLARASALKCGGSTNVCDGFNFPNDINAWVTALNNADARDAAARNAAARDAAARDAAAKQKSAPRASSLGPVQAQPAAPSVAAPTTAAPEPILPPSTVKPGPIKSDSLI